MINSLMATAYIAIVVIVMSFGSKMMAKEDSLFAPIAMISLFTLSAAVMAYLFCLQPILLYLDGKKKQAVKLFLQTVGVFGLSTLVLLLLLFFRVV